ncbi:MAG: ADOP family duplicated permease [Phycisphaerae bacterium]|nr:ADOP family duplicated permease [Phycisphaerae bacterium]
MMTDFKYALRMLRKRPGFTAIALITLAIGIGANTIMFSVVNALSFRPVNVKAPERLVICKTARFLGDRFTPDVVERIREDNPIFTDVMAFSRYGDCALRLSNMSMPGKKTFVTSNYFSVLGVTPDRGRNFLPNEETPGTESVGILSHGAWRRLGADPEVVGKIVSVNGFPCRIIGLTPAGFTGPTLLDKVDIWLSLGSKANMLSETDQQRIAQRSGWYDYCKYPTFMIPIGRLKPGLALPDAQTQFRSMSASLLELFDSSVREKNKYWLLQPLPRYFLSVEDGYFRIPVICSLIMGAGVTLLCIACLNLANMVIVQGASRHRELTIRTALGGGRWRIVKQLLVEALLLALAGGGLGLIVAFWGITLLNSTIAAPSMMQPIVFGLDTPVFLATLVSCLVATLLSGLWPAMRLSGRHIMSGMKTLHCGRSQASDPIGRLVPSSFSVAGQLALSVVLLMGAFLFVHSAAKAAHATPGYGFEGKLVAHIDFRVEGHTGQIRSQLCRQLVDHMRALPDIQAAGFCNLMHFGDRFSEDEVKMLDPSESQRDVGCKKQLVDAGYFNAVGMPLLQGRYFTREEGMNNASVAIIDETLARKLRPDGNVLGSMLVKWKQTQGVEIVGIVPGVRHRILEKQIEAHVYYPIKEPETAYLILRVNEALAGSEQSLLRRIRQEIRQVDERLIVNSLSTLSDFHRDGFEMWGVRMVAGLSLFFGISALFLATLGVYGIKGYTVATRIPEFGIRMALGATGRNIVTMVLREGWLIMGLGLALGMACALAVLHVLSTLILKHVLCDVQPIDPLSISATLLAIALATLLAGYIPARRAARTDPMVALRYE